MDIRVIATTVVCASLLAPWSLAWPDEVVGTSKGDGQATVPDPKQPDKMITADCGFVGRLGHDTDDPTRMTCVSGLDMRTQLPPEYEVHFINLVVFDGNPPKWKDDDGNTHQIQRGEMYVDPLRNGNIPRNMEDPPLPSDRDPPYDGEVADRLASEVGEFSDGDHPVYDLDDRDAFGEDLSLEMIFGDRPTLTTAGEGLRFITYVVVIRPPEENRRGQIYRMGGFGWAATADDDGYELSITPTFSGAGDVTAEQLEEALERSGFNDYDVEIPSTGTISLAFLAFGILAWTRHRA